MFINGKDISTYNGKLIYRNLSSNRVSSGVKWDYFLDRPQEFGSGLEFKDVKLDLLLACKSEQVFQYNLNSIAEELRRGGEIKFKDLPYIYTMYLKVKPEYEKISQTHYRVELNLDSDFGVTDLFSVNGSNSVTVNNKGLYKTPAIITLTVPSSHNSLILTGFEHSFKMDSIPSNSVIIIDALSGQITVNGVNAIDKVTSFHLPKLLVGSHNIKCNVPCNITIQYYERF